MPHHFQQRYGDWALVTGGHSGIGFSLAEQIAADGVNVVIAARTQKALDDAAAKITSKHKVQVRTVAADCSTQAGLAALIEAVKDIEIAMLVANAGVELHGYFVDMDPSAIERMIALNITAPTILARHYGRQMAERGRGAILLTSSILGLAAAPYMAAYAATKAYVTNLGESLSTEMGPWGVDVTVLSPGLTDTPMVTGPMMENNIGFPVDTPEHTAGVGLWAVGRRAHRIPLIANRIACMLTARLLPGWLVRASYRPVMAKMLGMSSTNPVLRTDKPKRA